jgi:hypothetical protein
VAHLGEKFQPPRGGVGIGRRSLAFGDRFRLRSARGLFLVERGLVDQAQQLEVLLGIERGESEGDLEPAARASERLERGAPLRAVLVRDKACASLDNGG